MSISVLGTGNYKILDATHRANVLVSISVDSITPALITLTLNKAKAIPTNKL